MARVQFAYAGDRVARPSPSIGSKLSANVLRSGLNAVLGSGLGTAIATAVTPSTLGDGSYRPDPLQQKQIEFLLGSNLPFVQDVSPSIDAFSFKGDDYRSSASAVVVDAPPDRYQPSMLLLSDPDENIGTPMPWLPAEAFPQGDFVPDVLIDETPVRMTFDLLEMGGAVEFRVRRRPVADAVTITPPFMGREVKNEAFRAWYAFNQVVSKTFGVVTEIGDALEAFVWNVYTVENGKPVLAMLTNKRHVLAVLQGVLDGRYRVHYEGVIIDLAYNGLSDRVIAAYNKYGMAGLRQAGWSLPFGANALISAAFNGQNLERTDYEIPLSRLPLPAHSFDARSLFPERWPGASTDLRFSAR